MKTPADVALERRLALVLQMVEEAARELRCAISESQPVTPMEDLPGERDDGATGAGEGRVSDG